MNMSLRSSKQMRVLLRGPVQGGEPPHEPGGFREAALSGSNPRFGSAPWARPWPSLNSGLPHPHLLNPTLTLRGHSQRHRFSDPPQGSYQRVLQVFFNLVLEAILKIQALHFIVRLFTIARTWKQPKCPLTEEWIKKIWYVYTMEYYSAIKRMK